MIIIKKTDRLTRSEVCQQCRHFRRHYIRQSRGRYVPILIGHCVFPRLKDRAADTPACPHFSARQDQDN